MIQKNCFYIDKTDFIREWWDSQDSVTLIARPRRFGKTLNMSMLEPRNKDNAAFILEFKVFHSKNEESPKNKFINMALLSKASRF